MLDNEYILALMRDELNGFPKRRIYKNSTQYAVMCPRCESRKSHEPHLYIHVGVNNIYGIPIFEFDCKKCDFKGRAMSRTSARSIGIQNSELLTYIDEIHKLMKNVITSSNTSRYINKLYFKPTEQMLSYRPIQQKLQYVYKRTGLRDVLEYPERYKIIPDLRLFFKQNKLDINSDYYGEDAKYDIKKHLRIMESNYVNFLSMNSTGISGRDITGKDFLRYRTYMIYPQKSNLNNTTLYLIPNVINVLNPNIEFILAEGVFDILRIFGDFYGYDKSDKLYASVQNKDGYPNFIRRMMCYGVIPTKISIYSDTDVPISYYEKMVRPLLPFVKLELYYNTAAKDYGNLADPLKLSKRTLNR